MKATKPKKKMAFPPALKLVLRGYMIIAFILLLARFGIVTHIPALIFLITAVSISMVFGVGCILVMSGRPVRSSKFDIPGTALFFAKGIIVLYFIWLVAEFGILPERIASMMIIITASILVLAGVGSYILEVAERSRPVKFRKAKPGTR